MKSVSSRTARPKSKVNAAKHHVQNFSSLLSLNNRQRYFDHTNHKMTRQGQKTADSSSSDGKYALVSKRVISFSQPSKMMNWNLK